MNFNSFQIFGLFLTLTMVDVASGLTGAIAQTPERSTPNSSESVTIDEDGAWVPIARVNPSEPIDVRIFNQAGISIEYSLTTNEATPRQVEPGATGRLGEIPIPAYVLINPVTSRVSLEYDITVDEANIVTVVVSQINRNQSGVSTFNINETGAIYVY